MKLLALTLVLAACRYGYTLPDGGPIPDAGDGCSCNDVSLQLVDDATDQVLLECVPNPETQCGRPLLDGGASCAAAVCFGARCCVWAPGLP